MIEPSKASDISKKDVDISLPLDTSLHDAARNNDIDQIKTLITNGVDINTQDESACTALYVATSTNKDVWFCDYSGGETESDECDYSGDEDDHRSPIYKAKEANLPVWDKKIQIINELLENGADTNLQNADGETALHGAVSNDTDYTDYIYDMVYSLLEKGADPTIEDRDGNTAYDLARRRFGAQDRICKLIFNALKDEKKPSFFSNHSPKEDISDVSKELTSMTIRP